MIKVKRWNYSFYKDIVRIKKTKSINIDPATKILNSTFSSLFRLYIINSYVIAGINVSTTVLISKSEQL